MEKEFRHELRKGEGNRLKYLLGEKVGRLIKVFGLRGTLWVTREMDFFWLRLLINLAIRGFIFAIFYALFQGNWILALICYAVLHVGIFFGGKCMEESFMDKLRSLESTFNEKLMDYYVQECGKNNIVGDAVQIENMWIRSGSVSASVAQTKAPFSLYCLESVDGDLAKFDRKLNPRHDEVDMKMYITSVVFNKKFAIYTKKGMEHQCVDMLRPSVQVAMCGDLKIKQLGMLEIADGYLHGNTTCVVDPAKLYISVYGENSIVYYFDEVDRYCRQMSEMAKSIYPELKFIMTGMNLLP